MTDTATLIDRLRGLADPHTTGLSRAETDEVLRGAADALARLEADADAARREARHVARAMRDVMAERDALARADSDRAVLREALGDIAHLVKTRSTGVRMDGTTEWPTPMHGQVYDLARAALAAVVPPDE